MISIDEAQRIVLGSVSPLPPERVTLIEALGCVLAEAVVAKIPLPPFDNSAMDGYAVAAETPPRGPSIRQPADSGSPREDRAGPPRAKSRGGRGEVEILREAEPGD